jgi:hypothetical protein
MYRTNSVSFWVTGGETYPKRPPSRARILTEMKSGKHKGRERVNRLCTNSRISAASPPDVRRGYAPPKGIAFNGAVPLVRPLA